MKNFLFLIAASSLFAACGGSQSTEQNATKAEPKILKIDGSSTVYPITEAVAEDYKAVNPNLQITIAIIDSNTPCLHVLRH
jgi:phosphate transport system substrate-binding protein